MATCSKTAKSEHPAAVLGAMRTVVERKCSHCGRDMKGIQIKIYCSAECRYNAFASRKRKAAIAAGEKS